MKNNYSPDILNCLANLSSDEVFTSPELANRMLDLLPQELFCNPKTRFLDPCSKSGVFLREIVKRLLAGLESRIPDLRERIDHILTQQVFGIACTDLTAEMSRRTLYCSKQANGEYSVSTAFDDARGNLLYERCHHTWNAQGRCEHCGASKGEYLRTDARETYAYPFIHKSIKEIFHKNMQFDVIIGNPPYQLSDGGQGASAPPIYHYFIIQALKLNPRYLSMIIPARWMSGGRGLDDFRKEMLNDKHIKELHDYPNSQECFAGVDIKGGICYLLWDKGWNGDCRVVTHHQESIITTNRPLLEKGQDIFIRYNEQINIINKIKKHRESSLSTLLQAGRLFGFHTKIKWDNKNEGWLQTADGKDYKRIYRNKAKGHDIMVFVHGGPFYTNIENIPRNKEYVSARKVLIPEAGNPDSTILGKPRVAEPNSCSSNTFIVALHPNGSFEKDEANNLITYLKTKLVRLLVASRTTTQHMPPQAYQFVPLQDFSHPWTDEMLYEKYGLNKDEIAFIESMIRPME